MCWECITYYRCIEYGLVYGKFVCSCCTEPDDGLSSTSRSTSVQLDSWTTSSLEGSDSGESKDSPTAYLNESIPDQPTPKQKEGKTKKKNRKRKRKGKSNKERRSKETPGKDKRNQDKSGSLREQLPEGDVSIREHAPGLLAEQLPGSPNVPQETGTESPLDIRFLVDLPTGDITQVETVPEEAKIIVLEIFTVSKHDKRHPCNKPICMYKIHIMKEGLQPATGKDDVKLYLTDAVTDWTGEVNIRDNEARCMDSTIKYCQHMAIEIVNEMGLQKGDTVTVRLQNNGYTTSILTRNGIREPIQWDLNQFVYLTEATEELVEYFEVDFYDVNKFQSEATDNNEVN